MRCCARGRRSITARVALEERMKESMIPQVDSVVLGSGEKLSCRSSKCFKVREVELFEC